MVNDCQDVYLVRVGDWDQDVEDVGEKEFSIQTVNFHPGNFHIILWSLLHVGLLK